MDNPETIESYLIRSGVPYESIGDGMWVVHDEFDEIDNMVVTHSPPLVLFRIKLMDSPRGDNTELYKTLLRLNATELVSGAYGLEDDAIVISETLQSENLDYNEFQAAVDGLLLALAEHYENLKSYYHQAKSE